MANAKQGFRWQIIAGLSALIGYLVFLYTGFMRVNVGMLITMFPWLLRQPDYQLYDTVIMQYTPGGIWLGVLLQPLIPDPLLRARLLMIAMLITSILLIFWLGRRWWGEAAGLLGAVFYAFWAPVFMVYLANYDVLVGLVVVAAVVVWHKQDAAKWQPFVAGLIVGMGILIKPHVMAVLGVYLVWRLSGLFFEKTRQVLPDLGLLLVGVVLPVALVIVIMGADGRLSDMIFWTWTFNWSSYAGSSVHMPGMDDWLLIGAFLVFLPLYCVWMIPQKSQWSREGILLLGLIPALATLAYPRFSRSHLAGVIPVIALISGAAMGFILEEVSKSQGYRRVFLRIYGVSGAAFLLVALALPSYYRVKLGPLTGEFSELIPVVERFKAHTQAEPGTHVWLVTDIDPTDNFYVLSGYLPAPVQSQIYDWYMAAPGLETRILQGIMHDPPPYALVFEAWRSMVPLSFNEHLENNYRPSGYMESDYGTVTFYELIR